MNKMMEHNFLLIFTDNLDVEVNLFPLTNVDKLANNIYSIKIFDYRENIKLSELFNQISQRLFNRKFLLVRYVGEIQKHLF